MIDPRVLLLIIGISATIWGVGKTVEAAKAIGHHIGHTVSKVFHHGKDSAPQGDSPTEKDPNQTGHPDDLEP